MHMLYNSDHFAVVQFDVPAAEEGATPTLRRGGFEIVDKFARREIFLEGALAEHFKEGVQALVDSEGQTTEDDMDDYVSGFAALAQHPVILH